MYQEPKNNSTNPELKKYYSYLKQNGADVPPDYNSFESTLKDVNASKQYYDYLKKEGFDAPDNYDAFASTFGLKKKESSQSPSVQPKSVSVPKTGSSGTQEFEYKPVYDEKKVYDKAGNLVKIEKKEVYTKDAKGNLVPAKEKVLKGFASSTEERDIVREEQKQKSQKSVKPTVKYQQYKTATAPKPEEIELISQDVDAELNQQGFWNGMVTGAKKGANFLSDVVMTVGTLGTETDGPELFNEQPFYKEAEEAKKQLISENKGDASKLTPELIKQRTKDIVVQKRTEGLKIDKNNQFLSSLPEQEKRALNLEAVTQYKTLNDKDKYLATEKAVLENEFESLQKDYAVVKAIVDKSQKEGKPLSPQFTEKALELEEKLKSKYTEFSNLEKEYVNNDKEVGSIEEEVDFLKRNYSTADKLKNDAKLGLADIYVKTTKGLPMLLSDLDEATLGQLRFGSEEGVMSEDERQQLIDEIIDWETAKNKTKSKFKKDVDFSNLSVDNFGSFLAQEVGTQIPVFAQMMLPGGVVSLGVTSAGDKYGQMETESNRISFKVNGKELQGFEKEDGSIVDETGFKYNPDEVEITSLRTPDYSKLQMATAAIGFGTAESLLGALPTKSALGRVAKSFEQSGKRQLIRDGIKSFISKPLQEAKQEAWTEGATSIVQNFIDMKVLGKNDVGLFDNVDHAMFTGGMLGGLMGSVPAIAGVAMRPFSSKTETKQVRKNLEMVLGLREQLNNQELTPATRKAISDKITALETENTQILTSVAEKSKRLSKEQYEAIIGIDKKQELLRLQANEIKADNSISDELKKQLLNDLKVEFSSLEDKRNILVSDKATILDTLPDSEKTKFRNEATQILKTEYKGEGEPKIEDEAITKKAIKLYNKSKSNEAKVTESTVEEKPVEQPTTQPQAEAQAEVGEVENVSLTNEVNIPESEAITTETLTENETTQRENITPDGNIQPRVGEVAEVGGIEEQATENTPTESISPTANIGTSETKSENIVIEGDDLILKHGTPHNFDKFQLEKIGTGEGAQAFGYGLYFTDGSKIAESYAKKLSEDKTGIVYTVRIKNGRTSNWADWREPLTQEQEEILYNSLTKEEKKIYQDHLEKAFYPDSPKYDMKYEKEYHGTFDDLKLDKDGFASYEKQSASGLIYMDLKDAFGQEKATEILKRSGIDGIRYKAKRGYGQETNYVVFNPESISIESKSNKQKLSKTENEVEYVKKEIDRGILNWSGDIGSPRIDLGISWADIRKGESDIRKGNVNTVPAKRLIEAINKAKNESGYRYKQGTGGANMRGQEFVTFEDIQRATNEDSLTDAEINEIIANQNELATEYDEYFNSLDEQTQNEILENYENQPREISEDSQRGESEINVSNEKETTAEPKQEVEQTILDRILNQDELKDTFDFLDSFKIDPNDLKATLPFLPEVWNAFIEAVKLSAKAGNSMRKTMDIAFDKMKQSGYDLNELTKVYNAFGKKFAENFIPKETKEFVEQIIPETSSQDKSFEFEKMASNFPNTGEVRTYMSGETYEKYTSRTPENDQEIYKIKLIDSLKHGVETIQIAIDTFGDNFVLDVLKFAETPTLSIESKALLLISLENELDRQYDAFPEKRKEIQRNLNLVLAKRQALASSASKVMNMNRLKAFAKSGFDINEITDKMFSNSEKESRRKIENAVQSNFDDINKAEEDSELGEDFEVNAPIVKREKSEVKKDISEVLKKMKEDLAKIARGGNLSVTIPGYKQLEVAIPYILKLAKLYAELEGITTKEIVSGIFNQISSTFPAIQRKDIANVIRDTQAKKEPKKDKKMKDLVKQALINRGYFREVNKKKKDGTREVVKLLDWKKLAGEEGSVKNIKNKTEEALKDMGYTDSQIQAMQKALLEEYNDLRASIIEKSINDLENRNRIKPVANRKTLAKKLSELYNLGMFENDMDNYENLLNSAIGFNTFQQKQYEELKEYGKALSVLFNFNNGKNKDQKFSELAIKTQAAIITKNIDLILSKATFAEAPKYFKLASIFQNFMGLSQRMKLVSLKAIIENPWSAKKNLFYQNAGDLFLVKENGDLKANRKKLAKYVYRDIVFNGSNIYGDVTTSLTTQSQVEEWLNKQSDNKLYHMFISGLSGRSFLEGADSSNKVLMTEKIFQRNIIKLIMTGKTDLGKMTEKEAMNWIAERMTGQNLENAQKLAEEVIDKVNTDAGKIILPKTEENIYRFASDIVKESLNQGKALDIDLIQKAYNSAYKSAGFNLGHEANNAISLLAGWGNQQVSAKLDRAIRDKKWLQATTLTLANILTKNIINPFVGGGTNWIVLGAQATGMDPFSIIVDYSNYRDNRIDLTTEEGIKNLENAMVRSSNLRNTTARTFVGAVISIGMAAAFVASGQADDLEDWLKKNEWARKYFKVFSPKAILLVLAYENGSLAFTLSDLLNQKTDNFNTTLKVINSIQSDKSSTSGEIGRAISGPMEVPFVPWRIVKDVQNVHKGLQGVPQYKSDYRVTGFLNGVYQGGLVDYIGLRPEGDFVPESKDSEKVSFPDPSKNLPNPMKGLPNY